MSTKSRVVIVADDTVLERLRYEPEGTDLLLRPDVAVVAYPPVGNDNELVPLLEAQGLLQPGALLVQSPFNHLQFAAADEARERFALEKHFAFTTLAAHLGAKLVEVEQVEAKLEVMERAARIKAMHPSGVTGKVDVEQELSDHLQRRMSLRDVFEGGEPDFDAAERLLTEKRLRGDLNMVSLLEARRSSNKITERKVSLSLTQESKSNLRVAASLTIPAYVNVNAEVTQAVRRSVEYRLTLRVVF